MEERKVVRKRKKKKGKTIFFIIILIIIIAFYLFPKITVNLSKGVNSVVQALQKHEEYDVIKKDENKNYSGVGQEKVKNKDGYFTTFQTNGKKPKTYLEYKQNGTAPWSQKKYWGGTMEENGCGITSMSIILSGYGKKITPEDLRKKYAPVLEGDNIARELTKTFGIKNSGFLYGKEDFSEANIKKHLNTNKPILVCVWNKPNNNRWTISSHYMVLLASDDNNMIYVSNPNGLENDSKSSGWYESKEIIPYIAKALFILE